MGQFVNILLTSNSENSITLDEFRSGRSLCGDKGFVTTSAQLIRLHLCSLLERFQRLCQSSQVSAMAWTSKFFPQPLPIEYLSIDDSDEYNVGMPEDASSIWAAPSRWRQRRLI